MKDEAPQTTCAPAQPRRWAGWLPWLALAYAATGFYAVRTNERALVRRCGKALAPLREPGLHLGLPWGIDRVTRLKVFESKRVGVGLSLSERALGRKADPQQSECLTGDRNLILVSAIVQYSIADPKAYLFNAADVAGLVRNTAGSALSAAIAGMEVDEVLTVGRIAIQRRVLEQTKAMLDACGTGVAITSVSLESVGAPQEVADAFSDVTSAREDRQRAVNDAEGYANRLIPQARGEAQRALLEAEGYREETVRKARGDADRFLAMAEQMKSHREMTFKRLVIETLEEVLPRLRKVVVDGPAGQALDLGLIEAKE